VSSIINSFKLAVAIHTLVRAFFTAAMTVS
jgi:hypothetical protein